ncbi:MAG: acetolactate decarboxylase [Methanomicrobiales archaeon]|nr:acetolactate decarboxylase [Methanomicrobiales archaeon]
MIKEWIRVLLLFGVVSLSIGGFSTYADEPDVQPVMYQVSAFAVLEDGNYSEIITVNDLNKYGNFGVGGFEDMDGELSQIDGITYKIRSDGEVLIPSGDTGVCFANTIVFDPEISYQLNTSMDKDTLLKNIEDSFPDKDSIYAFRVDGVYENMTVRSVPMQDEPYPPLTSVINNQSVFILQNISGSITGFWFPEWMQGVNYAGFHPHFITDSRDAGGHILGLLSKQVTVSIQPIRQFTTILG